MALLNDLIDMEFPEFVEKIQQNHNKLTEELVNAESKGQGDLYDVILKNPTPQELKQLERRDEEADDMYENKEQLSEMAYPSNFDLKTFSQLPTFKQRVEYCKNRLERVGEGTSRIAFRVDDEKVLKIAKNNKGISQNRSEADWSRNNYDVFAKIFEADTNNYTWIEMELTRRPTSQEFKNLMGISIKDMNDFFYAVESQYNNRMIRWGDKSKGDLILKNYVYTEVSEQLYSLYVYMLDTHSSNIIYGDWASLRNWGIAKRDGEDVCVIIDTGYSEDTDRIYHPLKYKMKESVEPNKKVIAYHGSQSDNLQFYQNHAFYLTNNYELAKELAFKDGDGGLYDGEVATVYSCELDIKKPYETYSETEYENYFVDTQLDRDYWLNRGFDSIIVHPTEISQTTYYIMLNPEESVKIINKDIFDEDGNNINESVDEIKKLSGVRLDEKVMRINKEVSHTRLVTSAYELNEIIKNNTELRVLYDKERNFFLVDTPASVHVQMINDALLDGIYEPVEWNGYLITGEGDDYSGADGRAYYTINPSRFVLLRTSSDPNDFLELTDDNYRYCYHYKNLNYVIFDNTGDFVETPLYQLLGKPEAIEHWDEDNGKFEILKESVEDARNINGYTTYMYKNPTMKELRDDKEANGEFRVVRVNDDFYFGDAEYWTHRHMNNSDDAIRLFYNLNNNTFYQDFETSSDEEYNEFYQEFVESMQEPYILNTFPNCKFKLFSKREVDNDTPFYLNETIEYDRIRDSVFKYVMQSREI